LTNGSILEETNNFLAFSFLINQVVVFKSYDATKEGGGNRDEMSKCFEGAHPKVQNSLSSLIANSAGRFLTV